MTSKLVYIILAAVLLFIGTVTSFKLVPASTTWIDNYPKSGTCESINKTTLKLTGPIDEAMRDCALSMLTPDIKTVKVMTQGGEVFAGRAIGYKLGEHPRHLIVDKACLSSCGNYFIPAAKRVTLLPHSVIGLHGTPDPHMLFNADMENHMAGLVEEGNVASEGLTRILKRKSEQRERQLSEEAKFAERFNVPKGWRHYREAGDADDGWRRHFTAGSDANIAPDKFMIVEQPMLTSCLAHVASEDYQPILEQTVFNNLKLWTSLKEKMGAYRSLNLTCLPHSKAQ